MFWSPVSLILDFYNIFKLLGTIGMMSRFEGATWHIEQWNLVLFLCLIFLVENIALFCRNFLLHIYIYCIGPFRTKSARNSLYRTKSENHKKEEERFVTDARAAASMAAWHIHACRTRVHRPLRCTCAFQLFVCSGRIMVLCKSSEELS